MRLTHEEIEVVKKLSEAYERLAIRSILNEQLLRALDDLGLVPQTELFESMGICDHIVDTGEIEDAVHY
ncbi:hypothetical protein M5X00_13180 [Paenibacillus alvei]|uniref:hypothetical protein n=1 Tax=Paenibacillus alvei TaxID=44250 RepID=UPI0002883187|nr:hypothetical protein [Paenibacillus alvei]EJW13792.1 hypothetical protein PAV_109p00220 [Paenibacillus alvei DSM 29]MCY9540524.1 hypothetical protein [Paenibacillus alvei]MCY9708272.1 hypothetical protein [Paenibacillus alvei]MCY9732933.1 hypothetical protein [Paenibacillus alvei]MCY9755193.1 hypothetical protein [Paenibacillus alvei]